MSCELADAEQELPKRLFVPSLALLMFVIEISSAILSLFLPQIAETFLGSRDQVAIGLASETSAINNAAEVMLAFVMSILAIRFRHKSLLLLGTALVVLSNVGCFFAPNLVTFQVFFAMEGAGSVVVSILAITLIGDTLPFSKKARAVSLFSAGGYLAAIVGLPSLLIVSNIAGWRSTFLLFGLPVSIVGLILAQANIPSRSHEEQPRAKKSAYIASFKQILMNKSALACLLGKVVGGASVVALYVITFYQQQQSLSQSWAVGLGLTNAALFLVGSLIGGRLINRFGAKKVAVTCGLGSGILTAAFFNMPTLPLTLAFNFASVIIGAFAIPAFICLTVDQVPKSRGTLMSLHRIALNAGEAVGAAVGGVVLALFSYQILGLVLGGFAITSAAIFLFLVRQPAGT